MCWEWHPRKLSTSERHALAVSVRATNENLATLTFWCTWYFSSLWAYLKTTAVPLGRCAVIGTDSERNHRTGQRSTKDRELASQTYRGVGVGDDVGVGFGVGVDVASVGVGVDFASVGVDVDFSVGVGEGVGVGAAWCCVLSVVRCVFCRCVCVVCVRCTSVIPHCMCIWKKLGVRGAHASPDCLLHASRKDIRVVPHEMFMWPSPLRLLTPRTCFLEKDNFCFQTQTYFLGKKKTKCLHIFSKPT